MMINKEFVLNNNTPDIRLDNEHIVLYYHLTLSNDIEEVLSIYLRPFEEYRKGIFKKDETDIYDISVSIGGINFKGKNVEIIFQTYFDELSETLICSFDQVQKIFEEWVVFISKNRKKNLHTYPVQMQEKYKKDCLLLENYFHARCVKVFNFQEKS